MAAITTGGSGNWSSTAPNAPWPGGVLPTAADDVTIANGHTVTVDVTTAVANSVTVAGGGTLQPSTSANSKLTVQQGITTAATASPVSNLLYDLSAFPAIKAELRLANVGAASGAGYLLSIQGNFILRGAAKTPYTYTQGALTANSSTSVVVDDATGWRVGDKLVFATTQAYNAVPRVDVVTIATITPGSGTTAATAAVSYLVNQVNDTVYINNGLDGATYYGSDVTFTDASTDLVNINVTGGNYTWAKIYAAFVYYRFTEAGIRSDIAYIDAPDTANYLLTSMKLKNISSPEVPLIVTGGWGRDASSGSSKDIIDTSGGDIYLAPDHVVPYATGSGLSGSQAAQLADAASYSALAATESTLARKLLRNKRVLDTATGIETVYDDNGAVLFTRAVYSDKDGTTLYNGTQPPHRVERYT
jgi:hypothetical protein